MFANRQIHLLRPLSIGVIYIKTSISNFTEKFAMIKDELRTISTRRIKQKSALCAQADSEIFIEY